MFDKEEIAQCTYCGRLATEGHAKGCRNPFTTNRVDCIPEANLPERIINARIAIDNKLITLETKIYS